MTWNYRLIELDVISSREPSVGVHEVYYDESGEIETWTEGPVEVSGENVEDAREVLKLMEEAFEKPVLKESELWKRKGQE